MCVYIYTPFKIAIDREVVKRERYLISFVHKEKNIAFSIVYDYHIIILRIVAKLIVIVMITNKIHNDVLSSKHFI